MLSFWERNSFLRYDYIIVGSGIVGLSAAANLLEKNPSLNILILERGIFPTGASTKNAGFACFGSLTEILADIAKVGEVQTLELVQQRWEGLQKLIARLGKKKMDLLELGGYELIAPDRIDAVAQMDYVNQLLTPLFPEPVFTLEDKSIETFGFSSDAVSHLPFNKYEAQINTGLMMKSLLTYVQGLGATIITGADVESVEDNGQTTKVYVQHTVTGEKTGFEADKVAISTNAFTQRLFPELDIQPGRGQVLITKPLVNLKFKGTFHMDEGYFYFRNFEDRVLFGGGRNLNFEGETTMKFEITEDILNALKYRLDNIILPGQPYEIDQTWAGIMAFNKERKPVLKYHSRGVLIGTCLNGMGVAIGSSLGEQIAGLLVD